MPRGAEDIFDKVTSLISGQETGKYLQSVSQRHRQGCVCSGVCPALCSVRGYAILRHKLGLGLGRAPAWKVLCCFQQVLWFSSRTEGPWFCGGHTGGQGGKPPPVLDLGREGWATRHHSVLWAGEMHLGFPGKANGEGR